MYSSDERHLTCCCHEMLPSIQQNWMCQCRDIVYSSFFTILVLFHFHCSIQLIWNLLFYFFCSVVRIKWTIAPVCVGKLVPFFHFTKESHKRLTNWPFVRIDVCCTQPVAYIYEHCVHKKAKLSYYIFYAHSYYIRTWHVYFWLWRWSGDRPIKIDKLRMNIF